MTRRLPHLLIAVIAAATLAGCGSSSDGPLRRLARRARYEGAAAASVAGDRPVPRAPT